jgi:hypothetical protein
MRDIIASLEHRDRICEIYLSIASSQSEEILPTMQEPFPELICLHLMNIAGEMT